MARTTTAQSKGSAAFDAWVLTRLEAGATIEQLAGELGASKAALFTWRRGHRTPGLENALLIERVCSIPSRDWVTVTAPS